MVSAGGFVTTAGDVSGVNFIADGNITADGDLSIGNITSSGDLIVSGNAYISKSLSLSQSLSITEISPYATEGGPSGSFIVSQSGVSWLTNYSESVFIISTSLEDERGLSAYEFHVTSSPLPDDRPDDGVWYFAGEGESDFQGALNLSAKLRNVLTRSLDGGPYPPVLGGNDGASLYTTC